MSLNFSDKAQELAYALMRIAVYIRRRDFRARVEDLALRLLEEISEDDFESALRTMATTVEFMKLGASVYEVETVNARTIIEELNSLSSAIRQAYGFEPLPDPQSFFSGSLDAAMRHISNRQPFADTANPAKTNSGFNDAAIAESNVSIASPAVAVNGAEVVESSGPSVAGASAAKIESTDGMVSIGSTIRQTAILNKIRSMTAKNPDGSLSGCRMRDLLLAFPNVSERTLRNDLQRLVAQNIVQRVGNGGPASFYVVK